MEVRHAERFTLVFEGSLRAFPSNPLKTETPFGTPIGASIGDGHAAYDNVVSAGNELADAAGDIRPTAPSAASITRLHLAIEAWEAAQTKAGALP